MIGLLRSRNGQELDLDLDLDLDQIDSTKRKPSNLVILLRKSLQTPE